MKNKLDYKNIKHNKKAWLSYKRERRRVKRLRLIINRQKKKNDILANPYTSKIIDILFEKSKFQVPAQRKLKLSITIPEVFSIIESPKKSLQTIFRLVSAGRAISLYRMNSNHSKMQSVDLSAESVYDLVLLEIQKEHKTRGYRIEMAGEYPKDEKLRRYLKAIGIIKNLKIKHEYLSKKEESDLVIFKMRSRRHSKDIHIRRNVFKEKVSADFVNHIDDCLASNNRRLTTSGKQVLGEYTGEIIDNIEAHSGMNSWAISGYLDNVDEEHTCEIAIFNFGTTIAETFTDLPRDSFPMQEIEKFVQTHQKSGFFSTGWKEEDLITLIALQGHVSCKNKKITDDRGQGTVDLINFFQQVHGECIKNNNYSGAKMAILSGNTHILIDGTYSMGDVDGRQVIAFNKDNDLKQKPDRKFVTNLGDTFFPGTVISIKFPMQSNQTEMVEQND